MTSRGNTLQPTADRTAIGLSLLCAAHCLLLPILVIVSPSIAALGIENEAFHRGMILAVVPVSAYALFVGLRKHGSPGVLAIGIAGLLVLGVGAVLGHETLGETGEKGVTLLGVALVTLSHLRNYRACQHAADNHAGSQGTKADLAD